MTFQLPYELEAALKFYHWLDHDPSEWTELRAIGWPAGSGIKRQHINNEADFIDFIQKFAGSYNIYVGINPRKDNKGGSAEDISRVVAIPFDVDSPHPKNQPSNELEISQAFDKYVELTNWMSGKGFLPPYVQMSGNGYHVIQKVNIPITDENRTEVSAKLEAYFRKAPTKGMDSIFDLPRIIKVPGTKSIKGKATPERPHRMGTILTHTYNLDDTALMQFIESMDYDENATHLPVKRKTSESELDIPGDKLFKLRPCFRKFVTEGGRLSPIRGNDHLLRLAMVQEAYAEDFTHEQILSCFVNSVDYNPIITRKQVNHQLSNIKRNGVRTWRCMKIHKKEGCLGESCPLYSKNIAKQVDRDGADFERSPQDFFTKTKEGKILRFVPKLLGDALLSEYKFVATDQKSEIWVYRAGTGVWKGMGIEKIQEQATFWLDRLFSPKYCKMTIDYIRYTNYVDAKVFNGEPHRIVVKNGVFNLDTRLLEEFDPDMYAINAVPIIYDIEAKCPTIDRFLSQVVPGNVQMIEELAGFCLRKDYFLEKIFMLTGVGANGKSRLLYMFNKLLGGADNISSLTLQQLATDRFAPAQLYGKLANIAADIPAENIKYTGTIKTLSGGTDLVTAQRKYYHHFQFINYAKLIFSANQVPRTNDTTDAFFRRTVIIDFPRIFKAGDKDTDPHIGSKITTAEELSGFFNKAVEGLHRLLDTGMFSGEKGQQDKVNEWAFRSNPCQYFVMNFVTQSEDPTDFVIKADLYKLYSRWCHNNNKRPDSVNMFSRELSATIPYVDEGARSLPTNLIASNGQPITKNTRVWFGVKVDPDEILPPLPVVGPLDEVMIASKLDQAEEIEEVEERTEVIREPEEEVKGVEAISSPLAPTETDLEIVYKVVKKIDDRDDSPANIGGIRFLLKVEYEDVDLKRLPEYLEALKAEGKIDSPRESHWSIIKNDEEK